MWHFLYFVDRASWNDSR